MSVHGADVAEAELFEQHSASEQGLEPVAHLIDGLVGHAADQRQPGQQVLHVALGILIEIGEPGAIQAAGQPADARADGHLVVVEDNQQVLAQPAGIVKRLEDDARWQSPIADHCDTVVVAMPQ